VFFSSDVGNPDTYTKFWTDIQMYTTTMTQPDPETFMNQYCSWEFATKANKWQGRNSTRWRNDEYGQDVQGSTGRARSGEARRDVHPPQRPSGAGQRDHPGRVAAAGARIEPEAEGARERLGTATSGRCRTGTARLDSGSRRRNVIVPVIPAGTTL
jgi:hypothetical protein